MARIARVVVPGIPHHLTQRAGVAIAKIIGAREGKIGTFYLNK